MDSQIAQTLDFVELLFDRGYLDITEEPEQETLTEAFILFCIDNGCYNVDYNNAEQKAFEVYGKQYGCEDNGEVCDTEFEQDAAEMALKICIRKLNTCKP